MANFPTTFAESPYVIHRTDIQPRDGIPFIELESRGFAVVAGISRADVADLAAIAAQEDVREYCPNDIKRRWADEAATEKQLAKDGGRAVFRLEDIDSGATAAFGWTGRSSDEERAFLPECENTFAIRVATAFQGKGLARPFTQAIVAGSAALYGVQRVGLETWASNNAAPNTYVRAGAALAKVVNAMRETQDITKPVDEAGKHVVPDVRLYMKFLQSL